MRKGPSIIKDKMLNQSIWSLKDLSLFVCQSTNRMRIRKVKMKSLTISIKKSISLKRGLDLDKLSSSLRRREG